MDSNRKQEYPYSLRTVMATELDMCLYRSFFYVVPPQEALTIERLYCHINFEFDSSVAAGDKRIEYIGITDEVPLDYEADANYQRRQYVGVAAGPDDRVDISMDLSHLLKRDNVGYREETLGVSDPTTGYTYVEVLMPASIGTNNTTGVYHLWKIDALFTTTGIR